MTLSMLRPALVLLVAFLFLAVAGGAHAQSCSATITDVDFGSPNLLSSGATDALATVTVTCTRIPFLTVVKMCPSLSDGSAGSSGSGRLVKGPGIATLSYQLFQDASRTQGWGAVDQPQLGTVPVLTLGNGFSSSATTTATIYARLYGSQPLSPPGAYMSVFTGAETAFTYAPFFVGSSTNCMGFVGTAVVRPGFDVTAVPAAGCSVTTTDLSFPATGVLTKAINGESSIRVTCTSKTAFAVSLDNGTTGTSPTARKLVSPAGRSVTYGLYRNSARTLAWGSAAAGLAVTGSGTGNEQGLPVYGAVPAQATPPPGTYTDRIVVTLTY